MLEPSALFLVLFPPLRLVPLLLPRSFGTRPAPLRLEPDLLDVPAEIDQDVVSRVRRCVGQVVGFEPVGQVGVGAREGAAVQGEVRREFGRVEQGRPENVLPRYVGRA